MTSRPASDVENPGGFAHIPALDGIRGFALLLVLYEHLFWANVSTGSRFFNFLTDIRTSSYLGVNLFFALSGFLITGILLNSRDKPHYFQKFYARRALRIFPLYYGVLIVLLLLTRPMHFIWSGSQYYFLTYTSNLCFWRKPAPFDLSFFNINHFWSLQAEEQFYLIWPLVLFKVKRLSNAARVCALGCIAAFCVRLGFVLLRHHPAFSSIYLPMTFPFSCADNLLYGCGLCILLRTHWRSAVIRFAPMIIGSSAVVLLLVSIGNHGLYWANDADPFARVFIPTIGFSLVGLSSAAVIAMTLVRGSRTERFFGNRALRFLGKYSYGTYVFHYSIYGAFGLGMRRYIDMHWHSKMLGVALPGLAIGLLSVLVAVASYHLYEVHFLKLKRYFSYDRRREGQERPLVAAQR